MVQFDLTFNMKNKVAVVIATLFISLIPNAASANHVSACYLPAGNDANHHPVKFACQNLSFENGHYPSLAVVAFADRS